MTARDELDRMQALADAATEGPWEVGHGWAYKVTGDSYPVGRLLNVFRAEKWAEREKRAEEEALVQRNIEFAAHARTDLPRTIAALRAVLDLHKPGEGASQGYTGRDYGYIEPYCEGCEASDEYAVEWPCKTVRAISTALGVSPA